MFCGDDITHPTGKLYAVFCDAKKKAIIPEQTIYPLPPHARQLSFIQRVKAPQPK
jgi:hypothetical protein